MTAAGAAATWSNTTSQDSDIESALSDYNSDQALITDDMNIDMAVTSAVQLDVKPEALNYPQMEVGQRKINSERDFTSLNLQNTGSEYIDSIWASASTPENDPFRQGVSGASGDSDSLTDAHDAGNFMQIRPQNASGSLDNAINSDVTGYHFLNRKEFSIGAKLKNGDDSTAGNWDQVPDFINANPGNNDMHFIDFANTNGLSSGQNPETIDTATLTESANYTNTQPAEVHVGTFRVADRDYYYALLLQSEGQSYGGELRVADASYKDKVDAGDITEPGNSKVAYHDGDTFGVYDFTDEGAPNEPVRWRAYEVSQLGSSSLGVVSGLDLRANPDSLNFPDTESYTTGLNRTYDVVVNATTGNRAELTRTRFNVAPESVANVGSGNDLANAGVAANTEYILKTGTSSEMLQPAESIAIDTGIEVPRGVVQGQVNQGTLTIAMTTDNSQTPGSSAEEYIHTNQ